MPQVLHIVLFQYFDFQLLYDEKAVWTRWSAYKEGWDVACQSTLVSGPNDTHFISKIGFDLWFQQSSISYTHARALSSASKTV